MSIEEPRTEYRGFILVDRKTFEGKPMVAVFANEACYKADVLRMAGVGMRSTKGMIDRYLDKPKRRKTK